MHDVLAVILGGGAGTRLYPLTRERAKPAVPLGGKYRLIDIPISNCLNSGLNHIFVLTQYLSASLNRHISWTYNNLGTFSRGWVQILAAEQTPGRQMAEIVVPGHRRRRAQADHRDRSVGAKRSSSCPATTSIVWTISASCDAHLQSGADVTIGVQPVDAEQAPELGILAADATGRIADLGEKPSDPELLGRSSRGTTPTNPTWPRWAFMSLNGRCSSSCWTQSSEPDFGHPHHPRGHRQAQRVCATPLTASGPTSAPSAPFLRST